MKTMLTICGDDKKSLPDASQPLIFCMTKEKGGSKGKSRNEKLKELKEVFFFGLSLSLMSATTITIQSELIRLETYLHLRVYNGLCVCMKAHL